MTRLNLDMKYMVDSLDFTQHILVPTRGHNMLDLLCNHPDIVQRIDIIPSISDHDAVVAALGFQSARVKLTTDRKVFLYGNGNYEGVRDPSFLIGFFHLNALLKKQMCTTRGFCLGREW